MKMCLRIVHLSNYSHIKKKIKDNNNVLGLWIVGLLRAREQVRQGYTFFWTTCFILLLSLLFSELCLKGQI